MAKNHDFSDVVAQCGATGFFTENPAVSLFLCYQCLASCKKSKKSLERLTGKVDSLDRQKSTKWAVDSTEVENSTLYPGP